MRIKDLRAGERGWASPHAVSIDENWKEIGVDWYWTCVPEYEYPYMLCVERREDGLYVGRANAEKPIPDEWKRLPHTVKYKDERGTRLIDGIDTLYGIIFDAGAGREVVSISPALLSILVYRLLLTVDEVRTVIAMLPRKGGSAWDTHIETLEDFLQKREKSANG